MSQWTPEIRQRLAAARLDPAREAEIAQELSLHLDDRYRELRAAGLDAAAARQRTLDEIRDDAAMRAQLSALERLEDASPLTLGDTTRRSWIADFWQDARYALRVLGASRGFTVLAVVTLALGIGATTAVYALVDNLLLRPLPYPHPDRLVSITDTRPERPDARFAPSYPNFADWRARSRTLEFVGLQSFGRSLILTGGAAPERASTGSVTADFFQVFGASPMLGRGFTDDDSLESAEPVAILSYGAWQRRYAGDPAAVGRTIAALDGAYRIVGILPESFAYARGVDFWLPIRMSPMLRARQAGQYTVYARLRTETTLQQARAEMDGIARQLAAEYPATNRTLGVMLQPMQEKTAGYTRPTLMLLLAAAGCILLIGCLNVAGLLVARGAGRAREIAVRMSLGAGRARIVRQLTTESVVLALLGGAAGAVVAWSGTTALVPLLPVRLPSDLPITVDLRVIAAALAASLLTGLLFGVAPAVHLARTGCAGTLKDGSGATSRATRRLGGTLVLIEIALALILVAGGGLMVRSLRALNAVPAGIDVEHTLAVMASPLLPPGADPRRRTAFYTRLLEQVAATPGVESAGAIDTVPFNSMAFSIAMADGTGARQNISPRWVTPGYFRTVGLPLVSGRTFSTADGEGAPCVLVINQFGARQMWPGQSPLGHTLKISEEPAGCEIAGVVGDVHHQGPIRPVMAEVYRPAAQKPALDLTIVARAAHPSTMTAAIAAQVSRIEERALPPRIVTLASMNDDYTNDARHRAILLGLLGGIGIVLASVGVFGLTAYSVAQRTREIGVRVALGATARHVVRTVVGALAPSLAGGVALGLFGAWAATRTVAPFLFGVTATDRPTFGAAALVLTAVALAACYIPARRALGVDPVKALRAE